MSDRLEALMRYLAYFDVSQGNVRDILDIIEQDFMVLSQQAIEEKRQREEEGD